MSYAEFLARKHVRAQATGIQHAAINPQLFPFQSHITQWALRQGRAAIFAGCGLGKSWMAIEWAREVAAATGNPVLILTALAVAQQFVREGAKLGVRVDHVRELTDFTRGSSDCQILVANYERLEKLLALVPSLGGIVLDESSILKNFDGKTRTALIETFKHTPYRLCCTATPSPNDPAELGNHAEFLGHMRHVDMLQRFFEHDAGDTGTWVLKGHGRKPFWQWVASWAVALNAPSDLGFDDTGYDLPPLEMHEHVVDVDQALARKSGLLFAYTATSLTEQREVRRASIEQRVAMAADLVASDPGEQWLIWAGLNDESSALVKAIPGAVEITGSDPAELKEQRILDFLDGKTQRLVSKMSILGWGLNAQCCARQCSVGTDWSFEAWYQAIRRSWRFGQKRPVQAHLVCTSADGRIVDGLRRKQEQHEQMHREMAEAMRAAL